MTQISTANLLWYHSGGGSNSSPAADLGGAISSALWSTTTALDDLFPDVTGAQAAAGVTHYRCLYFKNTDANANGLISGAVYLLSQVTPADANDVFAIGLDPATITGSGTATTSAGGTVAPAAVTFINAASCLTYAAALALGLQAAGGLAFVTPLATNGIQAVWFRRTVGAGATASGAVSTITGFSGSGTAATLTCSGGCVTAVGDTITIAGVSAETGGELNGTCQVTGGNGTTTVVVASTVTVATITNATITRPSGTWVAVGGDTTA